MERFVPNSPQVHRSATHAREQAARRQAYEQRRGTPTQRGYTSRWVRQSEAFRREHPICECPECTASGIITPSEVVDHIIPHKGDQRLFWDRDNWQALAKSCHDRKTARERTHTRNT